MLYSLAILWFERNRFLPAILAVSFSAVLIALQCGMLLGFISVSSRAIEGTSADLWIGSRNLPAIGFGEPIEDIWRSRLASQPEIAETETYVFGLGIWRRPEGGTESCYVIGSRLGEHSIGASNRLSSDIRDLLTFPGSFAVDETALVSLGLNGTIGETAEIFNKKVRLVAVLHGAGSGLVPTIYCSLRTAYTLLPNMNQQPNKTSFLLARCYSKEMAQAVAQQLRKDYPLMATWTKEEFIERTGFYWLTTTKAGLALGFAALLGFFVGTVITSQTLYAAVISSLKEYAVLRALGIPRGQINWLVLSQSFWIGLFGMTLAIPFSLGMAWLASLVNIEIHLTPLLLGVTALVTILMGELSGFWAIRSTSQADPASLLR